MNTERTRKALPPTYLFVALVVMVLLHLLLPLSRYLAFPATLAGLVPIVLGVLLNLAADQKFKRHRTTVKPYQESKALVTTFPFSISRHPMYLGLTLLLLGVALVLGTLSALLPVLIFPYLMNRIFIRMEEQMLAATFGGEWEQYRSRVRRWI